MESYSSVISTIEIKLQDSTLITAERHRDVEYAILNFARDQWLTGDIKEIDCNNEYIELNFETSGTYVGKGIVGGEREGWAICNGNNGTKNRTGRVSVGWGTTATDDNNTSIAQPNMTIGGSPVTFGEKTHVLSIGEMPTHSHDSQFREDSSTSGDFAVMVYTAGNDEGRWSPVQPGGNTATGSFRVRESGSGNAHNNAQPSIVTLFIQKL
jgi:microcystin-dependent protein